MKDGMPENERDATLLRATFVEGARWLARRLEQDCCNALMMVGDDAYCCDGSSGHRGDHGCAQSGLRWPHDMPLGKKPHVVWAGLAAYAAAARYPTPLQIEYVVLEDPENRGWYWRVRDGQLEVNFVSDDFIGDDFWERYSQQDTPGLTPTAKRCALWSQLFSAPSRQVPVP